MKGQLGKEGSFDEISKKETEDQNTRPMTTRKWNGQGKVVGNLKHGDNDDDNGDDAAAADDDRGMDGLMDEQTDESK